MSLDTKSYHYTTTPKVFIKLKSYYRKICTNGN